MQSLQPDDVELMRRIAQQDQMAFTNLMERHLTGLRSYLLRLSNNPQDADDLAQESMLKVWRSAAQYRAEQGAVSTWVYRIAHNNFVDFTRRAPPHSQSLPDESTALPSQGSAEPLVVALEALSTHDTQAAQAEADQTLAWLNSQLTQLPLNQRSALVLRYLQGYSTKETATILGLSDTAVESLTARARRYLQDRLSRLRKAPVGNSQQNRPNLASDKP